MALKLDTDNNFGLDTSSANRHAVFNHACSSGKPAYIIETDIMNASGLNQALGREDADSVMKLGWALQIKELGRLNPDVLYLGKPNGDETTTIISGDIDEESLKAALDQARIKFDTFLQEAGLSHLAHARADRSHGVQNVSAFLSIQDEPPSEERMEALVSSLHKDTIAPIKHAELREGPVVSIENFRTNSHARVFDATLNDPKWQNSGEIIYIIPDQIEALDNSAVKKVGIMQARHDRKKHYEALTNAQGDNENFAILRFDVHGLHDLNNSVGMEAADFIIDTVHNAIKDTAAEKDPKFQSYETDSRQFDIFVKCNEDDIARLQLEIYQAIAALNIHESIGAVPVMMTAVPIKAHRAYDVTMQRLEDQLSINKLHDVSLFSAHEGEVYCFGFDGESFAHFPDQELQSDASIPFARSAAVLFDQQKTERIFAMRVGEIMRFVHGDDYEGILRRHEIIKDLTEKGVVDRDSVIAQITESLAMEDMDAWLEEKVGYSLRAHSSSGITDAERQITQSVEITSGEMAGRWLPPLLGMTKEDYVDIKETCMQGQACYRMAKDLGKSPTDFAADANVAKSLLLKDIQTRVSKIPNKESRIIQSAEQAVRAIKFMSVLNGEPFSNADKCAGQIILAKGFYDAGHNLRKMGGALDAIGYEFIDEAVAMKSVHSLNLTSSESEHAMEQLSRSLNSAARSVLDSFDGQDRQAFVDNINAISSGLVSDSAPALSLSSALTRA